jgi:hypothetical protein
VLKGVLHEVRIKSQSKTILTFATAPKDPQDQQVGAATDAVRRSLREERFRFDEAARRGPLENDKATMLDYDRPSSGGTKRAPWVVDFLTALRATGVAGVAAQRAHISTSTVNKYRATNALFREAYDQALNDAFDDLEHSAMLRARDGVASLKFAADGEALLDPRTGEYYTEHKFSDALTMFLLRSHDPERFRENPKLNVNLFTSRLVEQLSQTAPGIDVQSILDASFKMLDQRTLPPLQLPEVETTKPSLRRDEDAEDAE